MKFCRLSKRMKKLFVIATEGKIKMAIEWDVINDKVNINWYELNGKLYKMNDETVKDRFISNTIEYFKTTDKYKEILKKYHKVAE